MSDQQELTPAYRAWRERVQAVTDEAHRDNLGGKHCSGFCEACADALLVAYVALPMPAPVQVERPDDEKRARELHQEHLYALREPWGPALTRARWEELEGPEREFFLEWAARLPERPDEGTP